MTQLTERQAYLAMFAFLDAHYKRTGSDDIGSLLGSLSLLPDGAPSDPAVMDDWARALTDSRAGHVSGRIEFGR